MLVVLWGAVVELTSCVCFFFFDLLFPLSHILKNNRKINNSSKQNNQRIYMSGEYTFLLLLLLFRVWQSPSSWPGPWWYGQQWEDQVDASPKYFPILPFLDSTHIVTISCFLSRTLAPLPPFLSSSPSLATGPWTNLQQATQKHFLPLLPLLLVSRTRPYPTWQSLFPFRVVARLQFPQ